ncbi:hexosaminidase D-like isoform X1 [Euwallacea fornicatus]|uniref:hexosaminidase D-like isoform X1 n=2 Tax=Euwallacea fornicatus TaxID=995702 RepID=UPI00338FA774
MDLERKTFDSCIHRIIVWRRKKRMSIIMLVIILLMLIFGIQFYVVDQKGSGVEGNENEDDAFVQNIKVKFIEAAKLSGQEKPIKRGGGILITNNVERFKHINYDSSKKQLEKLEVPETDQQLGIPYVPIDHNNPFIPKQRIVHFDLKGAPPTISYLKKIMSLSKNMGATGILLEYEDMFPYSGKLAFLSAKNVYNIEQITDLLDYAKELKLEIIPLIQTFGHMEFVLKHREYSNLREVPESPQALCPSKNSSLELLRELISQVLTIHPTIQYLHIGCDEVFEMGECEMCRLEIRENLFLKHVQNVVNIVHNINPKVQLIIWDDMLRHMSLQNLQSSNIGDYVEPMVWVYAEDVYRFVQPSVWDKYGTVFKTAWTASAFKGAFGETLYIPNAKRHLENNLRWLEVMATQSMGFKHGLRGIVITGWQRYDHFAVLCELLPSAIPSLILNLLATSKGFFSVSHKDQFLSALSCPLPNERRPSPFLNLDGDPNLWEKLSRCLFPGNGFFKLMYRLHNLEQEAKEYLDITTRQKGWMTPYNVKHNYSLPLRVEELTQDLPRVYHGMTSLARNAAEVLSGIVDNYTISEWIEQRVYPYLLALEKLQNQSMALKSVRYWPARPLPLLRDLERHGVVIG